MRGGRLSLLLMFAGSVVLMVMFAKWSIGSIPVRALVSSLIACFCLIFYFDKFVQSLIQYKIVIFVILGAAIIGMVTSTANGEDTNLLLLQIIEVHLQAFILLMVSAVAVRVLTAKTVVYVFLWVFGISSLFVFLQYVNFDFAWDLRLAIADFTAEPEDEVATIMRKDRPLGLSLNAILFANHLCFTLCMIWGLRIRKLGDAIFEKIDWGFIAAAMVITALFFISGNRSPILGIAVFLFIYVLIANRQMLLLSPVLLLCIGLSVPFVLDILASTGSRVFSIGDESAQARWPLQEYGLLLFLDNPLGYGLNFDSRDPALWMKHLPALRHHPNAMEISWNALHIYVFNVLNGYGFTILLLLAIAMSFVLGQWKVALPFMVYFIHIFFHNVGPLYGDPTFWMIIPTLPYFIRADRVEAVPAASRLRRELRHQRLLGAGAT